MINIEQSYSDFCRKKDIKFSLDRKITSYDETTLFVPAGMQQFKEKFKDKNISGLTLANIQSCLRLMDLDSIGDGTHFLYFNMIGLFSFRSWSVKQTIDFWMEYLTESLNIAPTHITIHPDKILEWEKYYENYDIPIKEDKECVWSDGELTGYCTEFYINDLEIGNIVNICGDCIDVGFGLERLNMVVNGKQNKSDVSLLKETIEKILDCGIIPGNKLHGYVLRKLMRLLWKKGGRMNNSYFKLECERQENLIQRYSRLKDKHSNKPKEWWFDTHGIDLDLI